MPGHAGHVRQTSADVRQRAQTMPDILIQKLSGMRSNFVIGQDIFLVGGEEMYP